MTIQVQAFIDSLSIMGQGMAGIFVVTGVIIASIYLLNAITAPKKPKDENQGN